MADKEPKSPENLDPGRLTPAQLAQLLAKVAGQKVSPERITQDVAAGAPTNPDGTLHLVHYTAWLVGAIL
ncbi:MAG: hypothetical protein SFX18_00550 [Pirellulales bacterium]|nr:hypothetical protein [Pirellulales bacterium]